MWANLFQRLNIEVKVAEESKKEEEDVFCVWGHDPFKQEAAEEDEKKYQGI